MRSKLESKLSGSLVETNDLKESIAAYFERRKAVLNNSLRGGTQLILRKSLVSCPRSFLIKKAIIFNDKVFTYKTLEGQTNKLAGLIISMGLEKDERVGIMMLNRPEFVIAFFGIRRSWHDSGSHQRTV